MTCNNSGTDSGGCSFPSSSKMMYKIAFVFLFVCLSQQVLCGAPLSVCKGVPTKGTVVEVLVDGGDDCKLKRGTNATIGVKFTPQEDIKDLTGIVHGVVAGVEVPFPLPEPDLCKHSGMTCPLKKGLTYSFVATIPVKSIYPAIRVAVKWEDKDESSNEVLCFYLDCELV